MNYADRTDKGNILIVDDTPANLVLLAGMLRNAGYRARPVPGGRLALQAAEAEAPELILLDIEMPEMNGYEVCARLKANPKLGHIPVLFISALTETMDKVRAFETGGVDFVTKPFQFEEVRARVETHLTMHRLQRDLERKYDELRRLQAMQDSLTHMIVHDLRSPLTGIGGYLQLLMIEPGKLAGDHQGYVQGALRSVTVMVNMINSLLDVNRLESGEMPLNKKPCTIQVLASEAVRSLGALAMDRQLIHEHPADPIQAACDPDIVRRVIANLLGNALKFTPTTGSVTIATTNLQGKVRVDVRDSGCGIPPQYLDRIFDKFAQVDVQDRKGYSTGLGLTFCKLAIEAHGGAIGVASGVGSGSTFWFELPAEPSGT